MFFLKESECFFNVFDPKTRFPNQLKFPSMWFGSMTGKVGLRIAPSAPGLPGPTFIGLDAEHAGPTIQVIMGQGFANGTHIYFAESTANGFFDINVGNPLNI